MPEDRGEPWDMFDKEDMSDMFSRAMLEKMQLVGELEGFLCSHSSTFSHSRCADEPRTQYTCFVCDKLIGKSPSSDDRWQQL